MTDPAADTTPERATSHLVNATMQHSVLGGVAVWHGFVILAALASVQSRALTGQALAWVIAVHVLLAAACLLSDALHRPALPALIATFGGVIVDLSAVSDWHSPLVFAAVWTAGIMCATPALILRPRAAALVAVGALVGQLWLQIVLRPQWPLHVRLTVVVLAVILFFGVRAMNRTIDQTAHRADEQTELANRSVRTERVARDTGRQTAEDARVLHDTVINTLSLIARGAGPGFDLAAVRRRAAHDAAVVRRLAADNDDESRRGGHEHPVTRGGPWLDDGGGLTPLIASLEQHAALPVDYHGPEAHDLERVESLLPVESSRAIVRAVYELVTNAAKHSGASSVRLGLELQPAGVVVCVSDDGVGFAGDRVPGRGLAESVFRRCADANVAVALDSAPGQGTTVTLTYSMDAARRGFSAMPAADFGMDARAIAAAGCWIWAGIIIGADLVLSVFRPSAIAPTSVAVSLCLAVLTLFAWSFANRRQPVPGWVTCLIVLSVPAGYLAPFAVLVEAAEPLLFFPALVGTAPLVILMMTYRSRVPLIVALVGLGAAVLLACVAVSSVDPASFPLAIVAAAPQVGLFAGWGVFVPVLSRAVEAYRAQVWAAFEADTGAEAQNALTTARQRWIRVGTRTSVALLDKIARGAADPRDPVIQQLCADEESYLRQLLLIDAGVLNLSPWLALALVKARARSVLLEVRGGTIDSADPTTARLAGEALLGVLDLCTPSDRVIVSLFTEAERPVCLILGPALLAPAMAEMIAANPTSMECIAGSSHTLISVRPPITVPPTDPALVLSERSDGANARQFTDLGPKSRSRALR
ncbi:sensor histidine kinase [Microbacterium sp. ZW T5_56]|uniref:sensor histidine kinase n=1 Tax=Microbacterium sp. ZW T5_56 TaxID=3378081 RepID=UPI0038522734